MDKYLRISGLLLIINLYGGEAKEAQNESASQKPHTKQIGPSDLNKKKFFSEKLLGTFSLYYNPDREEQKIQIVDNSDDDEFFFVEDAHTAKLNREKNKTAKPKNCNGKECCYPYAIGCPPKYYAPNQNIFFVWGEWLLWKPLSEDDLRWIIVNEVPVNNANAEVEVNNYKSLNYHWQTGFRVSAGFRFSCDSVGGGARPWQIDAIFTKLLAKVTPQQFETNDQNTLVLLRQLPTNSAPAQIDRAKGDARLKYERLNGRVAWPVWFNDNVIFRFMTGPTFAWVDQTLNASYNQIFEVDGVTIDFFQTELKWKFVGGGLLGASDVYLSIGKCFGFFIDGSFGLLVGRMRSLEQYLQTELDNGVFINRNEKYTRDFTQFKPTFTFSSGVDFKYRIARCLMIHILVGYEFNALFNMNQLGKLNQRTDSSVGTLEIAPKGAVFNAKPSDLYFHGLNARVGFDF